jgi:hypothetical protein
MLKEPKRRVRFLTREEADRLKLGIARALALSSALCAGDWLPDVRDPAAGMVPRGFRSARGLLGPWDDEEW